MDDNKKQKFVQDESGAWIEVAPDTEPSTTNKAMSAKGQVEIDTMLVLLESETKNLTIGFYIESADVFVYSRMNSAEANRLIQRLQIANDTAMELHLHNQIE